MNLKGGNFGLTFTYLVLPLAVFVLSSTPGLNRVVPFAFLIILISLLCLRFLPPISLHHRTMLWVLLVLTLVASTGWFFSPFFFALYLVAIGLGFVYTPAVMVSFIVALMVSLAFSMGEVNPTTDFLAWLSLLIVIPITLVLRKSFLV